MPTNILPSQIQSGGVNQNQVLAWDGSNWAAATTVAIGNSTVKSTTESFITESMVNDVLTKGSNKYKTDVTLNGDERVKPSTSESFINFKM